MEKWVAFVELYPSEADHKRVMEAVGTASAVLKQDLADFEIEWIVETLLYSPVDLLRVVRMASQGLQSEPVWCKVAEHAFKVITTVVERHHPLIAHHLSDIEQACTLPFDPRTRAAALRCLASVARASPVPVGDARALLDSLQQATGCQAPLALLLVIKRVHVLKDTLYAAVLQGVAGLLVHFGSSLETAQLGALYEAIARVYIHKPKCEEVCLGILQHHAGLFREWAARDAALRSRLWARARDACAGAAPALRAVYGAARAHALERGDDVTSLVREVQPHSEGACGARFVALLVLGELGAPLDARRLVDVPALEWRLAAGPVGHDDADKVSWLLESRHLSEAGTLLETAILNFMNLPSNRVKSALVDPILRAPPDLRATAVAILAIESSRPTAGVDNIERYTPLWALLVDGSNDTDAVRNVLNDFLAYLIHALDTSADLEVMPEAVTNLLTLTSAVLDMTSSSCSLDEGLAVTALRGVAAAAGAAGAAGAAALLAGAGLVRRAGDGLGAAAAVEFYRGASLSRCASERELVAAARALLAAPPGAAPAQELLDALLIMFSRYDVECKMLSEALTTLDDLISREELDEQILTLLVTQIEKLRTRKDLVGKDARTLHRDAVCFLGKHGHKAIVDSDFQIVDNIDIILVQEKMGLVPIEGMKMNLKRILQLSITNEDKASLVVLLNIMCNNSPLLKREEEISRIAAQGARALCRAAAHAPGDAASPASDDPPVAGYTLSAAGHTPATARDSSPAGGALEHEVLRRCVARAGTALLQLMSEEWSPGVRAMMRDALEELALRERERERGAAPEQLVRAVADHALLMLASRDVRTIMAGLEVSVSLVTALNDNNSLAEQYLPNLLVAIASTYEQHAAAAFKTTKDTYIDKMELFDNGTVLDTATKLLNNCLCSKCPVKETRRRQIDESIRKTIEMSMDFVNILLARRSDVKVDYFGYVSRMKEYEFDRLLMVLKCVDSNILVEEGWQLVLDKLLSINMSDVSCSYLYMQAIVCFLNARFDIVSRETHKAVEVIGNIMQWIDPKIVKQLNKELLKCLDTYLTDSKYIEKVQKLFEQWCLKQNLNEITIQNISEESHYNSVCALNVMLNKFSIDNPNLRRHIEAWFKCVHEKFRLDTHGLHSKKIYYSEMVKASLNVMDIGQIKNIVRYEVDMCRYFVHVLLDKVLREPLVLEGCGESSALLRDIVKCFVTKKRSEEETKSLLKIVDELWPTYETASDFDQRQSLLGDLSRLPVRLEPASRPLRWALGALCDRDVGADAKCRLVGALPGGDGCRPGYEAFARCLPTRPGEAGAETLRALLAALATTGDRYLLHVVATLAAGETTDETQWWDEAIESCMQELASKSLRDLSLYHAVYGKCWSETRDTTGVCRRMMLPLLRHSPSSACEEFFSVVIGDLLGRLSKRARDDSNPDVSHRYVVSYGHALTILQVAFEKIERNSLESPSSPLYSRTGAPLDPRTGAAQSWHLVRAACKLCVTLRDAVPRPPADAAHAHLAAYYRFACANYNCLCAAVCRRRPERAVYASVVGARAWAALRDPAAAYRLPVRPAWNQRSSRHRVSVELEGVAAGATSGGATVGSSVLSRRTVFLRTLSDNPLHYDLLEDHASEEVSNSSQYSLQLTDNELNKHPCAATITALLAHMAAGSATISTATSTTNLSSTGATNVATTRATNITTSASATNKEVASRSTGAGASATMWLDDLATVLKGGSSQNVVWLVCQAVCNSREALRPHAAALRPALLAALRAGAGEGEGEGGKLNGLHVDCLETLIAWRDDASLDTTSVSDLNLVLEALITTTIEHRERKNVSAYLLDVLARFLDAFAGSELAVGWHCFEANTQDSREVTQQIHHKILTLLTKKGVYMERLLPTLVDKLNSAPATYLAKLAELFGLAVHVCADEARRGAALVKLRQLLDRLFAERLADYIKLLYYTQLGYKSACDEKNFRRVAGLVPKVQKADKEKCLRILATYVSRAAGGDAYVADMFHTIDMPELLSGDSASEALALVGVGWRRAAGGLRARWAGPLRRLARHPAAAVRRAALLAMRTAAEELFENSSTGPSSKKRKLEFASPLLSSAGPEDAWVLRCLGAGAADTDEDLAQTLRTWIAERLTEDNLAVRLCECFYLMVYLPATSDAPERPSWRGAHALLDVFLRHGGLREGFQRIAVRDPQDTAGSSPHGLSKLSTMYSSYRGTFTSKRSTTFTNSRRFQRKTAPQAAVADGSSDKDIILNSLLGFSKDNWQATRALCSELAEALVGRAAGGHLLRWLPGALRGGGDLTPLVLDMCRALVARGHVSDSLDEALEGVSAAARGSEGARHVRSLREELRLRTAAPDAFALGKAREKKEEDETRDIEMAEDSGIFSLDGLVSTFGVLSDWDALTSQQQTSKVAALPPLWTTYEDFKDQLDRYTVAGEPGWFGVLHEAYSGRGTRDLFKRLADADAWPRRSFHISAVTEAWLWRGVTCEDGGGADLPTHFRRGDCLAEWAARLMIRTAYLQSLTEESQSPPASETSRASRSHELLWCERANETGLSRFVRDCVRRNCSLDLETSEVLPWLHQKLVALRVQGVKSHKIEVLEDALKKAEKCTFTYEKETAIDVVVDMNRLILQLNHDLNSLTLDKIDSAFELVKGNGPGAELDGVQTKRHRASLAKILQLMMTYYDELAERCDVAETSQLLSANMLKVLRHMSTVGHSDDARAYISMLLNRIHAGNVAADGHVMRELLEYISDCNITPKLDSFLLEHIRELLSSLSDDVRSELEPAIRKIEGSDRVVEKYKKCLQLLGDARYTLEMFCKELLTALKDDNFAKWNVIFDKMKEAVFDNEHAGTDYTLLHKHKEALCSIAVCDDSAGFSERATAVLVRVVRDVSRPPQSALRLSQLCPALAAYSAAGAAEHEQRCLARLLALPPGTTVVKFDEQVFVFTDSVRRPVVVRARLSSGGWRRWLLKRGAQLRHEAAARRVAPGYKVTLLSEECGLIEFLENHERLRSLIANEHDLDGPLQCVINRSDDNLIVSQAAALQDFNMMCDKVPPYALRYAMHRHSVSAHDFIGKQNKFLDTLSSMTIYSWILGVGDRHLQNVLWSVRDGGVCAIDWEALFQYGGGGAELPPARLTRNLLAAAGAGALEARLQRELRALRESRTRFLAVLNTSFRWMREHFHDKLPYIRGVLEGRLLPHEVTCAAIGRSDKQHRAPHEALLRDVFSDVPPSDQRTVELQVSCLLRQCTDPRILSVTRTMWEPWV